MNTILRGKAPQDLKGFNRGRPRAASKHKSGHTHAPSNVEIDITHPDRVIYPENGVTKQDVADYYAAVMDHFLPGVIDRPVSVLRCPAGTSQACFFQKHEIAGLDHVGEVTLEEESGSRAIYLYPKSATSVIELVQFGVLEFHPWGATVAQPDLADRIAFDLDPGDDVAWSRVVDAARLVRKLLDQIGLESFVRTTGGKGLHVVLPLDPPCPWEQIKSFTQGFAKSIAGLHPTEFVATSTKRIRRGRIFIDYLRNSRGATSIANYSLRARKGAPVATPLRWSELGKLRSGADYDIHSIRRRLAGLRKDPWSGFTALKQDLDAVTRGLDR